MMGLPGDTMQTELLSSPNYYNHWISTGANEPNIPQDPRYWTRHDVVTWLQYMAEMHHLPNVATDRFIMNGKALCLMTVSMFLDRVPLGGKLLYKDFQLRLARAMYSNESYPNC
ncbi:ets DNA-binding protein pokkuri [Cimex lectularius]|uniref:PNT domain-containing protein n=1 Tax=Cimex lectularius TaxID=79782 RepID=A0A8I6REL9_CIMLE|nr:ets DNA-binding protein pokkuri [Cimex lectularius]